VTWAWAVVTKMPRNLWSLRMRARSDSGSSAQRPPDGYCRCRARGLGFERFADPLVEPEALGDAGVVMHDAAQQRVGERVAADVNGRNHTSRHRLVDIGEHLDRVTTRDVGQQCQRELTAHDCGDRQNLPAPLRQVGELVVQVRPNRRRHWHVIAA
jgi:hypothetical protein